MTVVPYKNVKRPIIPVGDLPMLALFARGEQGAWYDPSDLATMFQDAAGTIPVTGVEQPVGLILDKSGNGNHASQVTTTARPMLSARVNLLGTSDVAQWSNAVTLQGGQADPFGGATAYLATVETTGAYRRVRKDVASLPNVHSIYAKQGTTPFLFHHAASGAGVTFNLEVGQVAIAPVPANTGITASMTPVGDGWWRCVVHFPAGYAANYWCVADAGGGTAGTAGASVYLCAPQSEMGVTATRYQRVTSATDYDWQGWPLYLRFDGVDDYLYTDSPYLQAETPEWSFGSAEQPSPSLPTFGSLNGNVFVQVLANNGTRVATRIDTQEVPRDPHWALNASQATNPHRWVVRSRNSGLYNGQELPIFTEPTAWTPFGTGGFTFIGRRGGFYRDKPIYSAVAVGRELSVLEMSSIDKHFSDKLEISA